jgi:hypothetical protein
VTIALRDGMVASHTERPALPEPEPVEAGESRR